MHVRYVGHSCLKIEMAGQRILTNPWWEGPAYDGLWCPHHSRVEQSDPENVSLVFITDEGEDHLHVPTLRSLSRQATILVPRLRDLSLRDFLLSLGFENVVEMAHQRQHEVTPGLRATLYRHGDGNLLVLCGDGRTILHANSAAQTGGITDLLRTAAILRHRHQSIDLLFASRHSHSWVPHCVTFQDQTIVVPHQWEKNAESRFLALVRFFEPRMAFPLEEPPHRLTAGMLAVTPGAQEAVSADDRGQRIQLGFKPGDCILDDQYVPEGQSRKRAAVPMRPYPRLSLPPEPEEDIVDEARLRRLQHRILRNLRERTPRLMTYGQKVECRIDLRDHPGISWFLSVSRVQIIVEPCDATHLAPMTLRLRLDVLESWASSVEGYRSLTTAMGARWTLDRSELAHAALLIDLVGRRLLPATWTERLSLWLLHPRRAFDIWRQRRLRRCQSEPVVWDRIDPYELLQAEVEPTGVEARIA